MTLAGDASKMAISTETNTPAGRLAMIRAWLYTVLGLIFAMVVVGGATRLTDSGLSITEWKPILGAIPPLNDADWQIAFDKYRLIPEYLEINKGMSLAEFQFIFWWEWGHRFLGRFIGLVFFVPAVIFWMLGWLPGQLKPRIAILFVLGGLQGAVGWWMVASGLVDRVDVSQYRLATHLSLACFLFAGVHWVALGLKPRAAAGNLALSRAGWALLVLVFIQIFAGALVAGMDAGLAYNTWPLMDGGLVPDGLAVMEPFWLNSFENAKAVQFNHRFIAYGLWVLALIHALWITGKAASSRVKVSAWLVFAAVTGQALIGIATLLLAVPLDVALMHQAGVLFVLMALVWHLRQVEGSYDFI
ncbi:MAG: COX15/CtaA family protein [Hyphomicrobiales bacterium]